MTRKSYTYKNDENDTFYYDYIQGDMQKEAVVINCHLRGHSKSSCIRRLVAQFETKGHSVYVLIPRITNV